MKCFVPTDAPPLQPARLVDDFAPLRARVARGPQRDVDAGGGQLGADPLQVGLTPAALGVSGIAPAQKQHRAHTRHPDSLAMRGL